MSDQQDQPYTFQSKVEVKQNLGKVYGIFSQYNADVVNLYRHNGLRIYGIVFLLVLIVSAFFLSLDNFFIERQYEFRQPIALHEDLRIVGLNDKSYKNEEGITSKDSLASIISRLHQAGARVIGLDYIFGTPGGPGYDSLRSVVQQTPGLVFVEKRKLKQDRLEYSNEVDIAVPTDFIPYVWRGYSNLDDEATWQMKLMSEVDHKGLHPPVPSFALAVMGAWHTADQINASNKAEKWIPVFDAVGLSTINTDLGSERLPVNFFNLRDESLVIKALRLNNHLHELKDKIVLVGAYQPVHEEKAPDVFLTPFGHVNGLLVHAAIVNNMLGKQYIKKASRLLSWVIVIFAFFIGFYLMLQLNVHELKSGSEPRRRHAVPILLMGGFLTVYFVLGVLTSKAFDVLLPIGPTMIATFLGSLVGIFFLDVLEARLHFAQEIITQESTEEWTYSDGKKSS